MDPSDIDSVIAAVERATETIERLHARLGTLPETPGWRAPTAVMVTWRLDQLAASVAGVKRDAEETLSSARRERHRLEAKRREEALMAGLV